MTTSKSLNTPAGEPPPLPPSVPLVEEWGGARSGWRRVPIDNWPPGMAATIAEAKNEPGKEFRWKDAAGPIYRVTWSIPPAAPMGRQERLDALGGAMAAGVAESLATDPCALPDGYSLEIRDACGWSSVPAPTPALAEAARIAHAGKSHEFALSRTGAVYRLVPAKRKTSAEGPLPAGALDDGPDVAKQPANLNAELLASVCGMRIKVWANGRTHADLMKDGKGARWVDAEPPYPAELVSEIEDVWRRAKGEPTAFSHTLGATHYRVYLNGYTDALPDEVQAQAAKAASAPACPSGRAVLRAEIAATVLPVFVKIVDDRGRTDAGDDELHRVAAQLAVQAADALLAELDKPPG